MSEYELQKPTFELSCRGELTVTLADDDFAFFGFHAKINEEIESPETGTIHKESNEMSEDDEKKWTVHVTNTDLRREDTVYYWIHVMRHGVEYHKTGSWVVPTDFYPKPEVCAFHISTTMQEIYEINYTQIEAAESSLPKGTKDEETKEINSS